MAHNDENGPEMGGTNWDKAPQPGHAAGPVTRMTHNQA